MACERQADFFINRPVPEVFSFLSTQPSIGKFKVSYVDMRAYQIHLSKGMSLISWGEDITVSFFDPLNGGTRIIVTSKPKLPTTLIDYGVNQKNVDEIQQYITSLYYRP